MVWHIHFFSIYIFLLLFSSFKLRALGFWALSRILWQGRKQTQPSFLEGRGKEGRGEEGDWRGVKERVWWGQQQQDPGFNFLPMPWGSGRVPEKNGSTEHLRQISYRALFPKLHTEAATCFGTKLCRRDSGIHRPSLGSSSQKVPPPGRPLALSETPQWRAKTPASVTAQGLQINMEDRCFRTPHTGTEATRSAPTSPAIILHPSAPSSLKLIHYFFVQYFYFSSF